MAPQSHKNEVLLLTLPSTLRVRAVLTVRLHALKQLFSVVIRYPTRPIIVRRIFRARDWWIALVCACCSAVERWLGLEVGESGTCEGWAGKWGIGVRWGFATPVISTLKQRITTNRNDLGATTATHFFGRGWPVRLC